MRRRVVQEREPEPAALSSRVLGRERSALGRTPAAARSGAAGSALRRASRLRRPALPAAPSTQLQRTPSRLRGHRAAAMQPPTSLWMKHIGSSAYGATRPPEQKEEDPSVWIPSNIRKKVCVCFVLKSHVEEKEVCFCGYTREQHGPESQRTLNAPADRWDPRSHIEERETDAFGDILFSGLGEKRSKYVRVSDTTESSVIYELMTKLWGLHEPNLLISVTGGAKDFTMKPRLRTIFRRGLVKVAQTTGAWVITGGTHTGVMKQVGQAVRDFSLSSRQRGHTVVTIGVATWGTVHNRHSLVRPTSRGPEEARSQEDGATLEGSVPAQYVVDEEGQGALACLDSNHSHFVLVDDGTHGQYGVEIPLRTRLEKFISETSPAQGDEHIKIPLVCVVLEGGPGTLHTVYNAISRGTPCVVVAGSGRVADMLAQVAHLPVAAVTLALVQQKLAALLPDVFQQLSERQVNEWTKMIQDIVRRRQLLTIFWEGRAGQEDVDVAILQALLKASRSHDQWGQENWGHQLRLAVAWNRVDLARSEIFTEERQWKPKELQSLTLIALRDNKPDFVRLFVEWGVRLQELDTWGALHQLYDKLEHGCLFEAKLAKAKNESNRDLTEHVSRLLHQLLGESTEPLYPLSSRSSSLRSTHICPSHLWWDQRVPVMGSEGPSTPDPLRDLLIWAIVQNRRELAEIIWTQSQDCIVAGLACSHILRELAKEEEDADRLDATLALADEYELKAVGVFTECSRDDERRAEQLLTRVSDAWGRTTCMQLALGASSMQFMAHSGVQAYLTKVWWGELCEDTRVWRVALGLLAFPLLLCAPLVTFRDPRLEKSRGLERLRAFFNAPVITFVLNILSYFVFLCLFAYVLMVDFQASPSWSEYLVYLWVFSLVCEELRQLFYDPNGARLSRRTVTYFSDFWNKLDITAILLFVVGLACRLHPGLRYSGRVLLALDFILFCLRLMHIFIVSRTLGPKIIILKRMMKDVFFFLFLLALWVVSFGVAKQAILIHNESRADWLFRGVLYHSYLAIFGQIPPDVDGVDFDLAHCSQDGSDPYKPKCPESDPSRGEPAFPQWLTVTLLCLYLLFTNILLLNLLIAMFNYTFQEVQERSDQVWRFQRHDLIREYQARPPPPPPFILLGHLHLLLRRLVMRRPPQRHLQFKNRLEKNEEAALLKWEASLKEDYLLRLQTQWQQGSEHRIRDISDKVDAMMDMLESERGRRGGPAEQRVAVLEEQAAQTARLLLDITQALRAAGLVPEEGEPPLAPEKGPEGQDLAADIRLQEEDPSDIHHVSARQLLYPASNVQRFPVPNEKVPWQEEFPIYEPPFHTAEKSGPVDPAGSSADALRHITFNTQDGALDRRSFHGPYVVHNGLPRNPMGRTGLQGRGALSRLGPNHTLQPVVTRCRRNQVGNFCRRGVRMVLDVLVVKFPQAEHWALPGGSQDPGESLPRKFKLLFPEELPNSEKLRIEFVKLLDPGKQVYRGYMDDPRNTDNAWIETKAINVHFSKQKDETLQMLEEHVQKLQSFPNDKPKVEVRWQMVDKRIPLFPDHKTILREVAKRHQAHY